MWYLNFLKQKQYFQKLLIWIFALSLVWIAIATKGTFNDEHDNWVGGQLILQGRVPYRDFFSHHAPLTYYLSALWQSTGFASPEWMRFGVMSFWLLNFIISYALVKSSMRPFVGTSFLVSAILAPAVSAQMFLAESFAAALFMTLFWCGYSRAHSIQANPKLLIVVGMAGFIVFFAAPVYIFSFALFLLFLIKINGINLNELLKAKKKLVVMALVYSVIPVLLSLQGAANNFKYDYFEFNSKIYYPLRLMQREETAVNSLLKAPWINARSFLTQAISASSNLALTLYTTVKQLVRGLSIEEAISWMGVGFNSYFEAIGNLRTLMWFTLFSSALLLVFKKQFTLAIFFVLTLLYLSVRTTDLFHASSLFFGIITFACITLHEIYFKAKSWWSIVPSLLVMCIFLVSLPTYKKFASQDQALYYPFTLTTASYLLNNSLQYATIQNLSPDIGLFHALPTLQSATRIHFYYPWIHAAKPLRNEVMHALQTGSALLIYAPQNLDYAPEIQKLLSENYLPLSENLFAKK